MLLLDRKELKSCLSKVTRVVPRKADNDALTCVLVSCSDGEITLTGSDGVMWIDAKYGSCDAPDCAFLVCAHSLKKLIDRGPKSDFVTIDEKHVYLGDIKCTIRQENPDDVIGHFPATQEFAFSVDAKCFDLVAGAMSDDVFRPYLQGALLDVEGGALVSTDGKRMYIALTHEGVSGHSMIVPSKTINVLSKIGKGKSCFVMGDESLIRFEFDDTVLTSKPVDGAFPNWKAVYDGAKSQNVNACSEIQTASIASLLDIASMSGGFVSIAREAEKVKISGFDLHEVNGDGEFSFRVAPGTVKDLIAKGETIKINYHESEKPIVVTGDADNWTGIIMPVIEGE